MNTIPLGPVDYVFTGVGSQPVSFAFYYPSSLDPDKLKQSLGGALGHFPILQSRLQKTSETDYAYRLTEDGLTFDTVECDSPFNKTDRFEKYIVPVLSVEGNPLVKISLTKTPNGSVLAASISHALVDGFSYFHFLTSWARLCRGERILAPCGDRNTHLASLNPGSKKVTADDLYDKCGLFLGDSRRPIDGGRTQPRRFFIPEETVRSYRMEAKRTHDVPFTENDVLTAHLWRTYLPQWTAPTSGPKAYVTCPFDFRRAMSGIPRNYFGCALCFATASFDAEGLERAPLGDLAHAVRNAVRRYNNDAVTGALNTLNDFRRQNGPDAFEKIHLRHPDRGTIITNLTRMPIRDMDFGAGAPADFLAHVDVTNGMALLPADRGVEAMVFHPHGVAPEAAAPMRHDSKG